VKVVHAVESTRVPRVPQIGYVGLGKEIGNFCHRVNDGSSDYADGVRNIRATNVGLQKRRVDLASIQNSASLGVERAYDILG